MTDDAKKCGTPPPTRKQNPNGDSRGARWAPAASRYGSDVHENVSAKGARVVSVRRWEKGAPLVLASRTGEFRSEARVAYCQPLRGDGYAIGVEFLELTGRWVV